MITFQQNQIKQISELINNGEVVAVPTDTVYGLICKYNDDKAINEIYKIKKRDFSKPLPILVGSWEQAKLVGIIDDKLQSYLLNNFKVGKVTFIVLKQPTLTNLYFLNKKTIAIRVTASSFIKILTAITGPLIGTSCNISTEDPIIDYKIINLPNLKYKVAGITLKNKPSVIFDSFSGKIIRK